LGDGISGQREDANAIGSPDEDDELACVLLEKECDEEQDGRQVAGLGAKGEAVWGMEFGDQEHHSSREVDNAHASWLSDAPDTPEPWLLPPPP